MVSGKNLFQSSGVKKLIILAIVKDAKENYENVAKIIRKLGLDDVDYYAAFDFKLANIFFGIESCSSSHPCVYCETASVEVKSLSNGHCRRYVKNTWSLFFSCRPYDISNRKGVKIVEINNIVHY